MIVKQRFFFKRMMVFYSNPDIEDAIEDLSKTVYGFLTQGSSKIKMLKTEVTKQICEMRQNQYEIDVKMTKLYDNTLKINSFLCLCNRQTKCEVDNLDKLKMYFDPNGNKNCHIKTKQFVQDFFEARKPLTEFFESVENAKGINSPLRSPGRRSPGGGPKVLKVTSFNGITPEKLD